MKMNLKKGFTLIELLVVIAIIGILSAVVLAALGTARDKAKDSAASAAISQMRAQAELETDYSTACTGTQSVLLLANATENSSGTAVCNNDTGNTAWAASIELSDGEHFCADSTGFAGKGTAVATAGVCA